MVLQVPGTSRGPVALLRAVPSVGAGLQGQGCRSLPGETGTVTATLHRAWSMRTESARQGLSTHPCPACPSHLDLPVRLPQSVCRRKPLRGVAPDRSTIARQTAASRTTDVRLERPVLRRSPRHLQVRSAHRDRAFFPIGPAPCRRSNAHATGWQGGPKGSGGFARGGRAARRPLPSMPQHSSQTTA